MKLSLAMFNNVEFFDRTVDALRVGPLAVHQRRDGRWQVSHIASGRATIPSGICCKPHAVKLAKALRGLNWEFTLPRDKEHVKVPETVKGEMEKAKAICRRWLEPCLRCAAVQSTAPQQEPNQGAQGGQK